MSDFFPASPQPGSNGIGAFAIGISPIGDIELFEWQTTVISQYANSPTLTQLIANMDSYIDQTENFSNFFDLVWNIDTAQGWGLDVWGRILCVTRVLEVANSSYFGFSEQTGALPFDQGIFYSGQPLTSSYSLTDDAYRTLLLGKALFNICDGSIPAINQILINIFGTTMGNCYVTSGTLTMTYTFAYALTPLQLAIVGQSGVLPTPAGVAATIVSH